MRKKKIITSVTLISLIIGISVFVCLSIFIDKYDDDFTPVYAESIVIDNGPRKIDVYIKNKIELNENFYTITPKDYNMRVKVQVLNSKYVPSDGIMVEDNIITPVDVGIYYIRYVVTNRYKKEIYDTLKINVVNHTSEATDCLELNSNYFNSPVGHSFNFRSAIKNISKFTNTVNFELSGEKIESEFVPTVAKVYNVKAYVSLTGYKNFIYFRFEAKDESKLKIEIFDYLGNSVKKDKEICVPLSQAITLFTFNILDAVEQTAEITSSNLEVATLSCDAPIITVFLHNVGRTSITLKKGSFEISFVLVVE